MGLAFGIKATEWSGNEQLTRLCTRPLNTNRSRIAKTMILPAKSCLNCTENVNSPAKSLESQTVWIHPLRALDRKRCTLDSVKWMLSCVELVFREFKTTETVWKMLKTVKMMLIKCTRQSNSPPQAEFFWRYLLLRFYRYPPLGGVGGVQTLTD